MKLKMRTVVCSLVISTLALSGCASMSDTQKGVAGGAGIGALAGAAIGRATAGGNKGKSTGRGAMAGAAIGALGGYIWSQRMEAQKQQMEQATQGTGIEVSQTQDNQLKLNIPSDISFDVGKSNIKPNFQAVLSQFAQGLNQNPATNIRIIGHTDSTGSDAVNYPLSVNRANSTKSYLSSQGVAAHRIQTEGRGKNEPIADNTTASGRAMNRRVEIFVAESQGAYQSGY